MVKVWIVEGRHHSVPGCIVKVCASAMRATLEAVVLINIIRKDLDLPADTTAENWELKFAEAKLAANERYDSEPFIEISDHEVLE